MVEPALPAEGEVPWDQEPAGLVAAAAEERLVLAVLLEPEEVAGLARPEGEALLAAGGRLEGRAPLGVRQEAESEQAPPAPEPVLE